MGMKYLTRDGDHEWFDVREVVPDGTLQYEYVLAYSQRLGYKILYYIHPENEWQTGEGGMYTLEEMTHWCYLPKQPKGHEW